MESSGGIQASLGGRYATALFDLARDEGSIDTVSASLTTLRDAMDRSDDLRLLTHSPQVGRDAVTRAIAAVAGTLELDRTTTRFLQVLAKNGRLAQVGAVIRLFRDLADRHYNRATAHVTSAHPLRQDQVDALKAKLAGRYGRDVSVDLRVDPALLGGLVVKVGSQQIDGSIRTKLNNLAHAMKA